MDAAQSNWTLKASPCQPVRFGGPDCTTRVPLQFASSRITRYSPAGNSSFLLVQAFNQISHAARELDYFSLSPDVEIDCEITGGSAINRLF